MADGPDLSTAGQMSRHISARIAKSAAMAFLHGIARYSDLLKTGLRRDDIRRLERLGRIGRVRRGWYAAPGSPPEVIRAVRIGGVLSCVSALRYYGVWVPPTNQLHIRRSEHLQAKLPLPANTHLCPVPIRVAPSVAVDPLETALLAATRCLDDEGMVVVLDSILNQRLLTRSQLAVILADCPRRVRRLLGGDGRAGAIGYRIDGQVPTAPARHQGAQPGPHRGCRPGGPAGGKASGHRSGQP